MGLRPAVGLRTAKSYQYLALAAGQDAAPLHGDCSAPYVLELQGQASHALERLQQWHDDDTIDHYPGYGHVGGYKPTSQTTAYVSVRCRKCRECLRGRARLWTARAVDEIAASDRTWFGTLTLSPQQQFIARCRADLGRGKRWSAFRDEPTPDEHHRAIVKAISPELTLWLKRIRKNSGATLRYLLVTERHKSGDPHFHILLHESSGNATKRVLEGAWKLGFSKFKLCDRDPKTAVYVCKYLAKSATTRVRSSREYGTAGPRLATERYMARHASSLVCPSKSTEAERTRLSKDKRCL